MRKICFYVLLISVFIFSAWGAATAEVKNLKKKQVLMLKLRTQIMKK